MLVVELNRIQSTKHIWTRVSAIIYRTSLNPKNTAYALIDIRCYQFWLTCHQMDRFRLCHQVMTVGTFQLNESFRVNCCVLRMSRHARMHSASIASESPIPDSPDEERDCVMAEASSRHRVPTLTTIMENRRAYSAAFNMGQIELDTIGGARVATSLRSHAKHACQKRRMASAGTSSTLTPLSEGSNLCMRQHALTSKQLAAHALHLDEVIVTSCRLAATTLPTSRARLAAGSLH